MYQTLNKTGASLHISLNTCIQAGIINQHTQPTLSNPTPSIRSRIAHIAVHNNLPFLLPKFTPQHPPVPHGCMNGPRFLATTHYFTNAAPSPPSPQKRVLSASCDRILLHNRKAKYTFAAVPVIHGLLCQTAACGKWPHFEQVGWLGSGGDA